MEIIQIVWYALAWSIVIFVIEAVVTWKRAKSLLVAGELKSRALPEIVNDLQSGNAAGALLSFPIALGSAIGIGVSNLEFGNGWKFVLCPIMFVVALFASSQANRIVALFFLRKAGRI